MGDGYLTHADALLVVRELKRLVAEAGEALHEPELRMSVLAGIEQMWAPIEWLGLYVEEEQRNWEAAA